MLPNKITKYVVRIPGQTYWAEYDTLKEAKNGKIRAEMIVGITHNIYAVHENGDITGPY